VNSRALIHLAIAVFVTDAGAVGRAIALEDFLAGSACKERIGETVQKWGSRSEWSEDFQNGDDVLGIKGPTGKIGTWIFLQKNPRTHTFSATKISPHTQLSVSWNPSTCEPLVKDILVSDKPPGASSAVFDDGQFATLLNKKRGGLIYAFTPFMHLSVEGIPVIEKTAQQLGLDLTLVSPQRSGDPRVKLIGSQELKFRGIGIHFPCLIVYSKNGEISGIFPGRKSEAEYIEFIRRFLQ
jgi:hypothetical protein